MQAVILADRKGSELAPLCDTTCPALMYVVDRPVLQHTIEDLAVAGVNEILVVASNDADRIEQYFADGAMWGVKIRYLLSRGEEAPGRLLSRFTSLLQPPFILLRGDVLRTPSCRAFLATASTLTAPVVSATIRNQDAALCLVRRWPAEINGISWPLGHDSGSSASTVELDEGLVAHLDSPKNFHWAALTLSQESLPDTVHTGRCVDEKTRIGRLSRFNPRCRKSGHVIIGENVSAHDGVVITGPSVVGNNCYLDKGVEVSNSVVMPGTYVGENLNIENAIVAGNVLIRIDRDAHVPVHDPTLLSNVESEITGMLRRWLESALAILLMILSGPLWPLAFVLSLLRSPRSPLVRHQLLSNRQSFDVEGPRRKVVTATKFTTRVPLLRNLPMLWLAIKGDLRVFGSTPLLPDSVGGPGMNSHPRQIVTNSGLLGPVQLLLPRTAPEEEIHLAEIDFVAKTDLANLLSRLARATSLLFGRHAWEPVRDGLEES